MTAPRRIAGDWYPGEIPVNVRVGEDVYLDSTYAFAAFHSKQPDGLTLGAASGVYDRASFVVGPEGVVRVGSYTVLNGCYLIAERRIEIGNHCLLAWGVVVSDCWPPGRTPVGARRRALDAAAADADHHLPAAAEPRPVTIGDGVWIGFDAVILPGVTLGQGCVVGCKTVVDADVPPYAVVAGSPARVLRILPDDGGALVRANTLRESDAAGRDEGANEP